MTANYDVAVVGGGPAGSTSAALLARKGHRVLLLERSHFPRPKACAEYMSPGVVATLQRLALESALDPAWLHSFSGMEIVSPRGASLRVQYPGTEGALSAVTVPRRIFDTRLVEAAVRAGAELREGVTVRGVITERGRVVGLRGSAGSQGFEAHARLIVVADGARSTIARQLGLTRTPRWPVRLGLVTHFRGSSGLPPGFGRMFVWPGGYCGVAPMAGDLVNVGLVVRADAVRRSGSSVSRFLSDWIAACAPLRETLDSCTPQTPVRGMVPVGSRTRRAWAPGALLVGDAAGFFDPFTGEGIYRALRGAELLSEHAHRALTRGDTGEEALVRYDHDRRNEFRKKAAVTGLVQLFVQYPSLMEYGLPRLASRTRAATSLSLVLGDIIDAGAFLNPGTLWSALRP